MDFMVFFVYQTIKTNYARYFILLCETSVNILTFRFLPAFAEFTTVFTSQATRKFMVHVHVHIFKTLIHVILLC